MMRGKILISALVVSLACLTNGKARSDGPEAVPIRAFEHQGYGRFVFDWSEPATLTTVRDGRLLRLRFERPFLTNTDVLTSRLRNYIARASATGDGRGVDILLRDAFRVETFRYGRSSVVDLKPSADAATARRSTQLAARTDRARSADRAPLADRVRAADTAPSVPVRVGRHAEYLRLVFDWTEAVPYSVEERASDVRLRFDAKAGIDADLLRKRLRGKARILELASGEDGLVLVLSKEPAAGIRHFKLGPKVVLDILKDAAAPQRAKAEKTGPAKSGVASSEPESIESESAEPLKSAADTAVPAPAADVARASPTPPVTPKTPGQIPEQTAGQSEDRTAEPQAAAAAPLPDPEQAESKQAAAPSARPAPSASVAAAAAPALAAAADRQFAPAAVSDEPPPPETAPVAEVNAEDIAAPESQSGGKGMVDSGSISLIFEWPEPVGAAVFRRDPYVWVVFDKRAQLNLAALRDAGTGVIDMIEQLPVGSGTVVRMIPKAGLSPRAELEGTNWVMRFQPAEIAPQIPIALRVRPEADEGTQLELPVTEFGQIVNIPDPEIGDMIIAATLKAPGHGVAGLRRYAEFSLFPSAQGIGIERHSDEVDVRDAGDRGIVISTPGGLHISSVGAGVADKGDFLGPRVFNLGNWHRDAREPFIAGRQAMFDTVASASKEQRDDARLDLARFYFARGYGPEALGVIRTIEYANPDMASQPEFRALKAAVQVLMGRPLEARKALLDPSLDPYREIGLWRGSMYLQTGEIRKAAAQFRSGEPALQGYPAPIRSKLAIELAEASLANLDVGSAAIWLDQMGGALDKLPRGLAARVRYNQGVLARDNRKLDEATAIWNSVKRGGDSWSAARAEFALIELGLQQETVPEEEAIDRLDRLRFQWRGDALELAVLRRLGELYLARNDFRRGLNTLRTAVTYFPNKDQSKDVARLMTESFRQLHLQGVADSLPPLKALALYDDFRELTPAGPDGDRMIQRLADRLVAVDLLDRAASLLIHQVRYRLKGEDRARIGAKLALILLLDRDPKGALSALRNSFQPNLPYDVEDDRRRIRAKATMELGRFEDAIALLAGDVSREADLLRANIYWKTKDYAEAAKVLQRLAGDPIADGTYSEDQARYILSWAVALRLKRDEAGVKMLRELYGPGMSNGKLADAFAYISSPSPASARNIEDMSRRIAETDQFEAFLQNYRERLIPVSGEAAAQDRGAAGTAAADAPGRSSAPPASAESDAGRVPPPPPPPQS